MAKASAVIVVVGLVMIAIFVLRRGMRRRITHSLDSGVGFACFDAAEYSVVEHTLICTANDGSRLEIAESEVLAWYGTGRGQRGEEIAVFRRQKPTIFLPDTADEQLQDALDALAGDRNISSE